MADIISLDKKLKISKEKKAELVRKRKIQAVQKIFQCTQCAFKCEKCGARLRSDPEKQKSSDQHFQRVPYQFCDSCQEEYIDYIDRLRGKGDPDCYWRNEEWLRLWKDWVDYQSSIDRYLKSKEFKKLLREIRQSGPELPDQ